MHSIAVISDIHGNSLALRAVLADIDTRGIGSIYCLGDLVGYGPDPNGVIDLIRAEGVPTVLGNYDDGVGWERGGCGCHYASAEAEEDDGLVFGHTHVPWSRMIGGVSFVNVGSVGRPKDGDPRATYTVLRAEPGGAVAIEVLRVCYDTKATARASRAAGLPAGLAEAVLRGI